jgi:hypothetical protein
VRSLVRVLVVMTVLLVTTTGRSSIVNESLSPVDESLPPGFGITYTKPPPTSPDLPMPYLVTPEHDPAKGGDPAYEWLHYALWRVGSSDLEEFVADVRSVLSGEYQSVVALGVEGLGVAPGRCYVFDPHHPEVEYPIPMDTFRRVFEVWYRAKAKYRDDQIAKFGKAES